MRGRSLLETYPEIAAQAHDWDPSTVTPGSGRKLEWKCEQGHLWVAAVGSRTNLRSGCPMCAGYSVVPGVNDLQTLHPEIAAQAHGWDPATVMPGSQKKYEWQCGRRHLWIASVSGRTSAERKGCPYCANKRLLVGYNDLKTLYPVIATQADGWDPETVIAGAAKKRSWRCEKGHRWEATPDARVGAKSTGCPYCANRRVLATYNDLKTLHPEVAAQAHGWDPTKVAATSNRKLEWQCPKGHLWIATVNNRTSVQKCGCSVCENRTVLVGYNDLAHTHPAIAAQADGWDPTTIVAGNNRKFRWRCEKGHTWMSTANNRTGRSMTGCPFCSNNQLLVGYNDLAHTHPEIAAQADGWDPATVITGTNKKLKWRCEKGHVWSTSPNLRTGGMMTGCPSCAHYGFDPNKDGWLYFLRHERWGLLQIGITNAPSDRVTRHQSRGWSAIEIRGPMSGEITRQWEQDILRALKRRGVALGPKDIAGKFSGFTESWIEDDSPSTTLNELMGMVYHDEECNDLD